MVFFLYDMKGMDDLGFPTDQGVAKSIHLFYGACQEITDHRLDRFGSGIQIIVFVEVIECIFNR